MSNEEESALISSGKLHFLEDVPQALQAEVARREIPLVIRRNPQAADARHLASLEVT